jgi:hypothetical protein
VKQPPEDDSDRKDLERLNAEPWMVELLSLNPEYVHWGVGCDYMTGEGDGWASGQRVATWSAFGPWTLDEMNECVHFYFEIVRDSRQCDACGQSGYNPATRAISDGFYNAPYYEGGWNHDITQDEVQALVDQGRLYDLTHAFIPGEGWKPKESWTVPTAEQVNAWSRENRPGHDAINRWILIEARARRLGVWGHCPECEGHADVFTAPAAHVSLTVWMLHPRKGASRGVEILRIEQVELPAVFAWLREAADRNAARFGRVPTGGAL